MLIVIAEMYGVAGARPALAAALTEAAADASARDGCLRYAVTAALDDHDRYTVVEEWRDEAALEAHYASPGFQRLQSQVHGLLARPSDAVIHTVSASRRPVASGPMDPRDAD